MAIQRTDPLRDLAKLQEQMNRLFDKTSARTLGPAGEPDAGTGWKPPVDLYEEQDRYVLLADLPGVRASDIQLHVERGVLRIEGERAAPAGTRADSFLRVERRHGRFSLKIYLPPSADPTAISARHRIGVLEITLRKKTDGQDGPLTIPLED
jgi:HSP20 family protein